MKLVAENGGTDVRWESAVVCHEGVKFLKLEMGEGVFVAWNVAMMMYWSRMIADDVLVLG